MYCILVSRFRKRNSCWKKSRCHSHSRDKKWIKEKRNLYDWWGITTYVLSLKWEDGRILLKSVTWKYSVQKGKKLFKLQLRLKVYSMWASFMGFETNPYYWTKTVTITYVWEGCYEIPSSVIHHVWVLLCCTLGELDWASNSECYRSICLRGSGLHQLGPVCVLFSALRQINSRHWNRPLSDALRDSE